MVYPASIHHSIRTACFLTVYSAMGISASENAGSYLPSYRTYFLAESIASNPKSIVEYSIGFAYLFSGLVAQWLYRHKLLPDFMKEWWR
jgi:hypothetical protein